MSSQAKRDEIGARQDGCAFLEAKSVIIFKHKVRECTKIYYPARILDRLTAFYTRKPISTTVVNNEQPTFCNITRN